MNANTYTNVQYTFISHHRAIADVLTDVLHELDEDCSEEESYYSSEGTDIDDLE